MQDRADCKRPPASWAPAAVASSRQYADNYRILHEVAERLRNGGPDDVDGLVADFRRAMQAYKFCQGRLDAIRAEIDAEVDRLKPEPSMA